MPLSAAWSRLQVLLPPITHPRSPVNCQPAVRAGTVDGGCQALPFNANNIRSTQLRSARACWQAGAVAVRLLGTPGVLWCSGAPRPKLGRRPKVDLGAQTGVVVLSIVRAELRVAWAARGALEGRVILKVNNRRCTRRGPYHVPHGRVLWLSIHGSDTKRTQNVHFDL